MFAGSRSGSQKPRRAQSARGLVVLATFLGLLMMAMSGAAQACSSGKPLAANESPPVMTVSLELKTDAPFVGVTSSAFLSKIDITRSGIACCGGAHHGNGAADCASGSCFACSAALSGKTNAAEIEDRTGSYVLSRQAPLNFASPDSQFRPPRQLV
ncbi:MAG: hypothetical protein Q8M24_05610 [Pseudolabrys sp.]|nr:hypothetical protein [Pseudolabrys sp.]MDP2294923.1 hypothetical protein [Pseudolabrys sp.]